MDIEAIDIAAGSVSFRDNVQCSVYGVGTFGIGSLWTIVRHDCSGALQATTRDLPWVGIWTPMPTATSASAETSEPSATPTATQTATATATTDPDATPTPTPFGGTPTATEDASLTATIEPPPTSTNTPPPITSVTPPTPTDEPDPDPTTIRIHLPIVVDFALRADFSAATAEPSETASPLPTSAATTATPTSTSSPSPIPDSTPTAGAAGQVVLQLAHGAGFSPEQLIGGLPSQAPWFVLYTDGAVLRRTSPYNWRASEASAPDVAALREALITRPDFFSLPGSNHDCGIADIGPTFVYAFDGGREHTVRGEGLEMYADDGCVGIPPGTTFAHWRALAEGIRDARTRDFGPEIGWIPEQGTLAVASSTFGSPRPWTVPGISLAEVAPDLGIGYGTLALSGSALVTVYAELSAEPESVQFFVEGGVTYAVGLRAEPPGWDSHTP